MVLRHPSSGFTIMIHSSQIDYGRIPVRKRWSSWCHKRSSNQVDWLDHDSAKKSSKSPSTPLFFALRNDINLLYLIKPLENSSSATIKTAKDPKCLNISWTTISTLLIIPILLTTCRITTLWPTRSQKSWLGYPRLNLRDGTKTFGPEELTRWETGSYKPKNIWIGLVVFVEGVKLMVQPCFATEVRVLVKPTLGQREYALRNECIADKPWC